MVDQGVRAAKLDVDQETDHYGGELVVVIHVQEVLINHSVVVTKAVDFFEVGASKSKVTEDPHHYVGKKDKEISQKQVAGVLFGVLGFA